MRIQIHAHSNTDCMVYFTVIAMNSGNMCHCILRNILFRFIICRKVKKIITQCEELQILQNPSQFPVWRVLPQDLQT